MEGKLLIQVAFAGHNRPHDLGEHQPVVADLDTAFALLKQAGVERARLFTGLAEGADRLAAAAWRKAGLGPVHAIFPYLQDAGDALVGPEGLAQTATWLDGAALEAAGRNAHLQQTRLLIGGVDLLVVVWTGEHARGAGGTADAVRLALDLGVPVLWIKPSFSGLIRLLRPEGLMSDFDFAEFREGLEAGHETHVEAATPENLSAVLNLADMEAETADQPEAPDDPNRLDDWLHAWLWQTYAWFRRTLGGRPNLGYEAPPLPPDLAEQSGFKVLTAAYVRADREANRLSAVHRSEQILLLLVMVVAAVVGSLPSLWPGLKMLAAAVELLLGLAALWVWSSAQEARQHERWGEERRLAEQLRLERAGWALGVRLRGPPGSAKGSEFEDPAHAILRDAGLPGGRFDQARVRAWGAWSMGELVGGQAAYHRAIGIREGRIAHRIHVLEDASYGFLFLTLAGFLFAGFVAALVSAELPHWAPALTSMISVIVPTVGAATMALEAKLEFSEQSQRSVRIAARLQDLSVKLGDQPSFEQLQDAARRAMRVLVAEASQWREGVGRRQLFRP